MESVNFVEFKKRTINPEVMATGTKHCQWREWNKFLNLLRSHFGVEEVSEFDNPYPKIGRSRKGKAA